MELLFPEVKSQVRFKLNISILAEHLTSSFSDISYYLHVYQVESTNSAIDKVENIEVGLMFNREKFKVRVLIDLEEITQITKLDKDFYTDQFVGLTREVLRKAIKKGLTRSEYLEIKDKLFLTIEDMVNKILEEKGDTRKCQ